MSNDNLDVGGVPGMFGASLRGKRDVDEDFVACGDFGGVRVGVLCDGMGGGESGEVASRISARGFVTGVGSVYRKSQGKWPSEGFRNVVYGKIIEKCHSVVSKMSGGAGISGTTITALVVTYEGGLPSFGDIIHMGDSRCYRLEGATAEQITDDHSVTGDMLRSGYIEVHEISETSGSNVLTMNIGDEQVSKADVSTISLGREGSFLICCDGVWDPLHGQDGLWMPEPPLCTQRSAESFVEKALEMGSTDNCSVLLIDIGA